MNSKQIAAAVDAYKRIYVPYPRQTEFHKRCDHLRAVAALRRDEPQEGMRVLAPSNSGKSRAAEIYRDRVNQATGEERSVVPVLLITLVSVTTSKRFYQEIVKSMGDPYWEKGNEQILRGRAEMYLRRFEVELLIADEIQHLNERLVGPRTDITDTLKRFLDSGIVPIVFMGTENAAELFTRNVQLSNRLLPPCDYPKLRLSEPADCRLFSQFVGTLDRKMVEHGLFKSRMPLDVKDVLNLMEVCDGVIGRAVRLIRVALEGALRRSGVHLEISDLSWATDEWAISQKIAKSNPWLRG